MTEPYIPGFLAFREVNFLLERLEAVKAECPQFLPQVHILETNL
jgi:deoxyinosine 3'endonuclease (endonuclease V)